MTALEVIAASVLASLIVHLIQKVDKLSDKFDRRSDSLDDRLDAYENRLTTIEASSPKWQSSDRPNSDTKMIYYSPNSGINL
jgi:hypothetical protein